MKLYLYIISFSIIGINYCLAQALPLIEKGTQRFYKLDEMEYVCNNDNRISEESTKQILKTVMRIYSSQSVVQSDKLIIDTVWDTLHKVSTGGHYDEVLFACLRYKCSNLYKILSQIPLEKNDRKVLVGGLLYEERGTENRYKEESTHHPGRYVNRSQNSNAQPIITRWVRPYTTTKKIPYTIHYHNVFISGKSSGYVSREDALKKACDVFSSEIDSMLKYWLNHCYGSFILSNGDWDNFLIRMPKPILVLPKGVNGKAEYDLDAMKAVTAKVVEICLKYCQSNEAKDELTDFARMNGLKFEMPKKENKKPLF